MLEDSSKNSGKPKEEVYLEVIHQFLRELAKRESSNSQSEFDKMFSEIFETSVRVNEPYPTFMHRHGVCHPAVALDPNKITGPDGVRFEVDWSGQQLCERIAAVFCYILRAEWVRTLVIYQP